LNRVNFIFGWEAGDRFGFAHHRPLSGIVGCAIQDQRGVMPPDTFVLADLDFDSQQRVLDRCDVMRKESNYEAEIVLALLYKPDLAPFQRYCCWPLSPL
jgi:hypothetical protein